MIRPTGYAKRWLFKFDAHGVQPMSSMKEWRIYIWIDERDPDAGVVLERALGSAPILTRNDGGRILSSSLEWDAECEVDGEFSGLYTQSPTAYPVTLEDGSSTIYWCGWIVPELYSAPYVNAPYDVHLIASDNLNELKRYRFTDTSRDSIKNHLHNILDKAGYNTSLSDVYVRSTLRETSLSKSVWDCYAQLTDGGDDAPTYWDVLERILSMSGAWMAQHNGVWLIVGDYKLMSDELLYKSVDFGTNLGGGSPYYPLVKPIRKQASHSWLPDGYLTDTIEPARNTVRLTAPFIAPRNIVSVTSACAPMWNNDYQAWRMRGGSAYPALITESDTSRTAMAMPHSIRLVATPYVFNPNGDASIDKVKFKFSLSVTSGGTTKYWNFNKLRWQNSSPLVKYYEWDADAWDTSSTDALPEAQTMEIQIPSLPAGTVNLGMSFDPSQTTGGTQFGLFVHSFGIAPVMPFDGWQNSYALGNGAREEAEEIRIAAVDCPSTVTANWGDCVPNSLCTSLVWRANNMTSTWSDTATGASGSLVNVCAMLHCAAYGLPRIHRTGTLISTDSARVSPPIAVSDGIGGTAYLVRGYRWNILEQTVDIDAYTFPTATISSVTPNEKKIKNRLK